MTGASHEVLEHVGELEIRVRAPDLQSLFAEAGQALAFELLRGTTSPALDPGEVGSGDVEVSLSAPDRAALLLDWLNELIYYADARGRVLVDYEFRELGDTVLCCRARSVAATAAVPVKAATFHGLEVEERDGAFAVRIILDV